MIAVAAGWPCLLWHEALTWLQPAMTHGGETDEAEVTAQLDCGRAQLWLAIDGNVRAALVTTRHGDRLHLWLCGGNGCDWPGLLRQIMAFVADSGVTRWTLDGRPGWSRVLKGR